MPLAVRRVGGAGFPSLTYTLGPDESFRLDSASYTIRSLPGGNFVIPTLTARNSGGLVVAEIEAAAPFAPPRDTTDVFAMTGPAAFSDDFTVLPPGAQASYSLHDFGAAPATSQLTTTWPAPPALAMWQSKTWLSSAGAVGMSASIGSGEAVATATATATLTSGIAAGHYALLHMTWIGGDGFVDLFQSPPPTVTDSVGGNRLDFSSFFPGGYASDLLTLANGLTVYSWIEFYRIVNPLGVGDTITATLNGFNVDWLHVEVHDVTGLTVGHPVGPNAGGNYAEFGSNSSASPFTTAAAPVPKWVGGVFFNGMYTLPLGGTLEAEFGRGVYSIPSSFATLGAGSNLYAQVRLPRLTLAVGDTLTATTQDDNGLVRGGDAITGFHLWAVDE